MQCHARAAVDGVQRGREHRLRREARRGPAVQALGLVAPGQAARRLVLDDDLVDLRALAAPVAVHALAPPDARALDDLAAVGEREPLPQPAGLVEQRPDRLRLGRDGPRGGDVDHESILSQFVKGSTTERFEAAYGTVWMHLRRGDDGDLSEHERQLLHHIPAAAPGVPLGEVARAPRPAQLVGLRAGQGPRAPGLRAAHARPRATSAGWRSCSRAAAPSAWRPTRCSTARAWPPPSRRSTAAERRALVSALERVAEAGAALPPSPPRRRRRPRSTS